MDNSDFMRNGDFLPTRLQAQQDAVSLICHSKIRSNPENNVGLLTLAKYEFYFYSYAATISIKILLFYFYYFIFWYEG